MALRKPPWASVMLSAQTTRTTWHGPVLVDARREKNEQSYVSCTKRDAESQPTCARVPTRCDFHDAFGALLGFGAGEAATPMRALT